MTFAPNSWDQALFFAINGLGGGPSVDAFFEWGTDLGSAWVAIPLTFALVLARQGLSSWPRALKALLIGLAVGVPGSLLKLVIARPRPAAVLPNVHIVGPTLLANSFPSGHTMTVFIVVGLLVVIDRRLALGLLAVALFVGFSRVYVGAHYPSDVLGGALLGFVPSFALARRFVVS